MEDNKCTHVNSDGSSSIVFDTTRAKAVYPCYIHGICTKCKKNFKLKKEDYYKFLKGERSVIDT